MTHRHEMAVLIRTGLAGGAAAPDRLRRRLRTAPGCKLAYARRCVRLFRSQPSPPSFSTDRYPGRKQPPLSPCAASRSCQLNLTRAHFLQAPLGMVVVPLRPRRLGHVRALSGEALRDAELGAASFRTVLRLPEPRRSARARGLGAHPDVALGSFGTMITHHAPNARGLAGEENSCDTRATREGGEPERGLGLRRSGLEEEWVGG